MSKRTWIVSVVILLLIVCTSWAFWPRSGIDPKVKAILQKQASRNGPPTPQQRKRCEAEMKQLTDAQRQQVGEARRQRMQQRMQQTAAAYCALSAQSTNRVPGQADRGDGETAARVGRGPPAGRRTGRAGERISGGPGNGGRQRPRQTAPATGTGRSRRRPRSSRSQRSAASAENGRHDG